MSSCRRVIVLSFRPFIGSWCRRVVVSCVVLLSIDEDLPLSRFGVVSWNNEDILSGSFLW